MKILDRVEYRALWQRAGFTVTYDHYLGREKIGLNMEPCRDSCSGLPCPCNKSHYLDPTSEAVVRYKGDIWAFRCATQEALTDASTVILDIIQMHFDSTQENHRMTLVNAQLRDCIQQLGIIVSDNLRHDENCVLYNAAAVMRGRTECSCGVENSREMVRNVIEKSQQIV